ncbi:DNA polymerase IV [candidate division WOR-3 bacterium]|nr:DNA polymerase IV [candidate division WOR-3 bacterium]
MIIFCDLDAYFASVEQALNPELKGKPVVVGGDPKARRGVVAAASYEARKFGIHSAQPIAEAKRLCPRCIVVGVHPLIYKEFSRRFFSILKNYTPDIEIASLDEAYLDVSGSMRLFGSTLNIAKEIKERIKKELGITSTISIAKSKIIAKIATEQVKPDGLIEIPKGKEEEFISPLPISEFPGIGKRTQEKLNRIGIYRIGDLLSQPPKDIYSSFGICGIKWLMGIHQEGISQSAEIKSISKSHTMRRDTKDIGIMYSLLYYLTEKVVAKLQKHRFYTTKISVRIRASDFSENTEYKKVSPMNLSGEIYPVVREIFDGMQKRWVRLLGVGVTDFTRIPSLFQDGKRMKLEEEIMRIRNRFGFDSVLPLACTKGEW